MAPTRPRADASPLTALRSLAIGARLALRSRALSAGRLDARGASAHLESAS
jgi:hypothetical protein